MRNTVEVICRQSYVVLDTLASDAVGLLCSYSTNKYQYADIRTPKPELQVYVHMIRSLIKIQRNTRIDRDERLQTVWYQNKPSCSEGSKQNNADIS